jgi:hypothetical protein
MRTIVIFERDERHTPTGQPELDFRLERQALPNGAAPLWIGTVPTIDNFPAVEPQHFTTDEAYAFALDTQGL